MKTAPSGTLAFLNSGARIGFRADLITVTLQDGTTKYRWTTCERSIVSGGNTFLAGDGLNAPIIKASPFKQSSRLSIDTMDLTLTPGGFVIGGKGMGQLAREGYFDGSRIQRDHLVGPDYQTAVANGPIDSLYEGRIGQMSPAGPRFTLRSKSELVALNVMLPRYKLQATCGNVVYDADCGISRAAFTVAGTASGTPTVISIATTSAAVIAKATNWFKLGVLTFTSGALNGTRVDVQGYVLSGGTGTFTLAIPLSVAPLAGDTFAVYPGCPRTRAACAAFPNAIGVTNNLASLPTGAYRGFPFIPNPESGS
jgi:uncharacterized phage protein (TIGR02218 family)